MRLIVQVCGCKADASHLDPGVLSNAFLECIKLLKVGDGHDHGVGSFVEARAYNLHAFLQTDVVRVTLQLFLKVLIEMLALLLSETLLVLYEL